MPLINAVFDHPKINAPAKDLNGSVGGRRYRSPVIVKRVTRVALTRTTKPTRNDHTSYPDTELWRVEWTEMRGGKANELMQSHYTEAAARKHIDGLLSMRTAGTSMDSVYTERI
jgi:hypothetical protein